MVQFRGSSEKLLGSASVWRTSLRDPGLGQWVHLDITSRPRGESASKVFCRGTRVIVLINVLAGGQIQMNEPTHVQHVLGAHGNGRATVVPPSHGLNIVSLVHECADAPPSVVIDNVAGDPWRRVDVLIVHGRDCRHRLTRPVVVDVFYCVLVARIRMDFGPRSWVRPVHMSKESVVGPVNTCQRRVRSCQRPQQGRLTLGKHVTTITQLGQLVLKHKDNNGFIFGIVLTVLFWLGAIKLSSNAYAGVHCPEFEDSFQPRNRHTSWSRGCRVTETRNREIDPGVYKLLAF